MRAILEIGASGAWGIGSTILWVLSWTMAVSAALHLVGAIRGRVPRAVNLAGFVMLVLGAGVCEVLRRGGDRLVFDVLHLVGSSFAGAVFLWARVVTVVIAVVPVLRLVKLTWRRTSVPSAAEKEGLYKTNSNGQHGKLDREQEALAAARETVQLKPNDAEPHGKLGVVYGCMLCCLEALLPGRMAHHILGSAYGYRGRYEEAVTQFKEAIRLKPDYAEPHSALGVVYGALGRGEEARAECGEAVRLKPDYAEAHWGLGFSYYILARDEEAIAEYKEAIRLKPGYAEAHYELGLMYVRHGDRDAALDEHRILKHVNADLAGKLFKFIYP